MRKILLLTSMVTSVSILSAIADASAACSTSSVTFAFENETVKADMLLTAKAECRFRLWSNGSFDKVEIVANPRNGNVTVNGLLGLSYKPSNSFAGTDQFSAKICGTTKRGIKGCTTVAFAVSSPG